MTYNATSPKFYPGLDEDGRGHKSTKTDPIYQNLKIKERSPSEHSAKTELEDVDDLAKTDMAIRISHYVDNEVENELNEIVIPLKEASDTDTHENQDIEELILCTPEVIVEENAKELNCAPEKDIEEKKYSPEKDIEKLKCIPKQNVKKNSQELKCEPVLQIDTEPSPTESA